MIEQKIIKLILNAQAASDCAKRKRGTVSFVNENTGKKTFAKGKRKANSYIPNRKVAFEKKCGGYRKKDSCILQAVDILNKTNIRSINYYVKKNNDSYIVYFNIKRKSRKYQLSFHTLSDEFEKFAGKGMKTHWKKQFSCVAAARALEKTL